MGCLAIWYVIIYLIDFARKIALIIAYKAYKAMQGVRIVLTTELEMNHMVLTIDMVHFQFCGSNISNSVSSNKEYSNSLSYKRALWL